MREDETILCRCEDVTQEKIRECLASGCETIDEIKRLTRAGMGPCQGRTCRMLIAQEIASYYHVPIEDVLMPTFRPPTLPVSMGVYADGLKDREDEGGRA